MDKEKMIKLINYHQQKQKEAEDQNEPYRRENYNLKLQVEILKEEIQEWETINECWEAINTKLKQENKDLQNQNEKLIIAYTNARKHIQEIKDMISTTGYKDIKTWADEINKDDIP